MKNQNSNSKGTAQRRTSNNKQKKQKMKTILQIESLEAQTLLSRFDKLESLVMAALGTQPKQSAPKQSVKPKQAKNDLLNRDEVAEMCGVTTVTVSTWAKNGTLTPLKKGKHVYYQRREVEAVQATRKQTAKKTGDE